MIWSVAHKYSLSNIPSWSGGTWQKTHSLTAFFDNPSDRHAILGEKLQACILENPTNWAAQDKLSCDRDVHGLCLSWGDVCKPSEPKTESSNGCISIQGLQCCPRDVLLHKSLIPSLKSWNIKNKKRTRKKTHHQQKKKSGGRLKQRTWSTAFC